MNALTNRTGTLQAPQLDYILLDASGSMYDKWHESLAAIDGFVDTLRALNVNSHGILSVFSDTIGHIERDATLDNWPTFQQQFLRMRGGGTALYDAINLMCRELRDLDPPKASIVIVTDGLDMDSRHTTAEQARALLDWCRAKGWQVTFLGANFNNAKLAGLLGLNERNALGVQTTKLLEAAESLARKRAIHAHGGADIEFSDDERQQFGGFLTGPSK